MSDSFGWLNTDLEDFTNLLSDDDLIEEPVDLTTFIYDKHYLGNLKIKKISDVQRKIIEGISQVFLPHTLERLHGKEEAERLWKEDTKHEIIAMCGKGSGKDFSARVAFAYTIYKLHCLRDPIAYYGKAAGTYIDLLNIAVNAEQAHNVFFQPLKNMLSMSPYFNEKGFEPRKKELVFNSAPIRLFSGNSEAEAWEGLDVMLIVLDEIAAFKTDSQFKNVGAGAQRLSASGIYRMSKASVMSRFPSIGKCVLLSFPRYRGDFIMQRYEESATESHVLRIKAKTYEMNPMITREMLEPEFKRNPVDAKARYECEPPEMVDAFFRDPHLVRSCFKGIWEEVDLGDEVRLKMKPNPDLVPIDEQGRLKPWFKCDDEYMRFIHVDLGLKRDRAALCMAHSPGLRKVEVEHGIYESLPVVKMDLVHYWEATPGKDIDFSAIRDFIRLLCKKFPVGLVTFDRWQSVDTIQILQRRGINCDTHSVKRNDYDTLASCFYDRRFSGYFDHILVEEELLKLQTLENGKVEHPDGQHDDVAQALAGAVYHACEYAEYDTEIEIDILGDDDWEAIETQEAIEEDIKRDGRYGKERSSMTYDEGEIDEWELQVI